MAGAMISLTGCGSSSQSTSADITAGSASSEAITSAESTASGNGSKTVIEYWHCNAENQGGLTVDELVKNLMRTMTTLKLLLNITRICIRD